MKFKIKVCSPRINLFNFNYVAHTFTFLEVKGLVISNTDFCLQRSNRVLVLWSM